MSSYVSDWSQEVYGDVMKYAVAGAAPDVRRDELNAWLQHPLSLVNASPPDEVTTARTFLQSAYTPLANAAWRYGAGSGFGGTDVPTAVMQDYVSAQTYAMRSAGTHLGFAWTPKRPEGESSTQFAAESGALLDRLATAIHDSVVGARGRVRRHVHRLPHRRGVQRGLARLRDLVAGGARDRDACGDRGDGNRRRAAHRPAEARRHRASRHAAGERDADVELRAGELRDDSGRAVVADAVAVRSPSGRRTRASTTGTRPPGRRASA